MGGKDSSSKRKSSKRKRDKTSSQNRSRRKEPKKRSRIHDDESSNTEHTLSSASKSDHKRTIHKNKKLRRDYLTSSSSDDEPMSSDSDTSSIDYKRKKARRSQLNLKSNKKWVRPRSAKPKGDGDAHSRKKRKRSGKDDVPKPKKRSPKKKPKKHLSSSSSSDSESCSTCKSNNSSSTADGKRKRSKIILDNERERPRVRESTKSRKKRKIRSPSCSFRDRGSKHSDGALSPVNNNNSRRLRSVIAVADQRYDEGEENRWEKDPQKEEIVYDQNDYPSPKSLDSNDGGNKMELDNQSHGVSSKMIVVENVKSDKGDQDNDGDRQLEAADVNNFEKGKEIDTSVPVAALGGDVLESILRQKALENLKKFKGRLQTGCTSTYLKMNNESNVNRSSDVMVENVQNESTKQGNSNFQELNQNSGLSKKSDLSKLTEVTKISDSEYVEEMNRNSGLSQKKDLSQLKEVKKLSGSENVEKESGMATQTVEHPTDGASLLECSEEGKYVISNAVSTEPVSRTDTCSGAETMNAGGRTSITEPCSSIGPMTEEQSLERGNEAKDGSQFEQKTMSVMRGGEMVQVSYKVYIPKKTPALARKPLRR